MEPGSEMGFALFGVMILVAIVISLGGFALFLWALIDCVQREFRDPSTKIVWILVIVLVGVIGAIIYLIVGRPMGTRGGPTATGPPPGHVS